MGHGLLEELIAENDDAIGINWDGRRSILAVELASCESGTSWRDFVLGLKERGLSGVCFVVTDDHEGLKKSVAELLPEAIWQRCYIDFLRNALDYLPRKADDDCLQELRWIYDRRDLEEAQRDLQAWLPKRYALRAPLGLRWGSAPADALIHSGKKESRRQKQLFGNSIAELDAHNSQNYPVKGKSIHKRLKVRRSAMCA
jgi:transposase-like protein